MLEKFTFRLIFFILTSAAVPFQTFAQVPLKTRSVRCMAGTSESFSTTRNQLRIQQHVGQQGISGTVRSDNQTLIQGFIVPNLQRASQRTDNSPAVEVHPVPHSHAFNIHLPAGESDTYTVTVYHVNGQAIYTRHIRNQNTFEINLEAHPTGYYVLMIRGNKMQYVKKLPMLK